MDQRPQVASAATSASRRMRFLRWTQRPILLLVGLAAVLEVPGRRTGTPRQVTLIPWEVDGTRYLMSQYGVTDWVRDLRSAGRGRLRHKGRTQALLAIEVDGAERDRVIATFTAKTPGPFRRDYNQLPDADDHPTFRLEPIG